MIVTLIDDHIALHNSSTVISSVMLSSARPHGYFEGDLSHFRSFTSFISYRAALIIITIITIVSSYIRITSCLSSQLLYLTIHAVAVIMVE